MPLLFKCLEQVTTMDCKRWIKTTQAEKFLLKALALTAWK